MAESQGTWVKLGEQSWQFIPHEVKQMAHKLDLTWEAAATMAKPLNSTVSPATKLSRNWELPRAQSCVSQAKGRNKGLHRDRRDLTEECKYSEGQSQLSS